MDKTKLTSLFSEINVQIEFDDISVELPISYEKRYNYQGITLSNSLKLVFIKEKRVGSIKSFVKQAEYVSKQTNLLY